MSFYEFAKSFHKGQLHSSSAPSNDFRLSNVFLLLEKLGQFLFVKDIHGAFIYGNENFLRLMNATPASLAGTKDTYYFPQPICQQFKAVDDRVCQTGDEWAGEEMILFPNGDKKIIWCSKTPLRNDAGGIIGVVGIFVDVTRNHEEQTQIITQQTNDLVHEILIPMDAISSNLEALLDHENGAYALDSAERIKLLSLAQSELHILGMHAENMQRTLVGDDGTAKVFRNRSIMAILKNCRKTLAAVAALKRVEFRQVRLQDLDSSPVIEMFEPDMTRAFKNIYHNAVKYSYAGSLNSPYPKRWIDTTIGRSDSTSFFVEIVNFGVGITAEELPHIFDPGKRGKYSIDRQRTGSGIGLSQVKRIVERHGGTVSARSEKLGGPWRTTLRVVLPYRQSDEAIRYADDLEDTLG